MTDILVARRLVDLVRRLKPGTRIEISWIELRDAFPVWVYNNASFLPADQILEKIVGSAYEYVYTDNLRKRSVVFARLEKPVNYGEAYISPDRR
jgi:hypothetical protein